MSENDYLDDDSYPSLKLIDEITNWDAKDFSGLIEFIRPFWRWSDAGYFNIKGDKAELHTGGWSGNEEIIAAMQANIIWWSMYWFYSKRGGHYVFKGK